MRYYYYVQLQSRGVNGAQELCAVEDRLVQRWVGERSKQCKEEHDTEHVECDQLVVADCCIKARESNVVTKAVRKNRTDDIARACEHVGGEYAEYTCVA